MSQRLRNLTVALLVGAVAVAGFFSHGIVGGVLLLVTVVILGSLSWALRDRVRPEGQPLRVAVLLLLVVVAVIKFVQG